MQGCEDGDKDFIAAGACNRHVKIQIGLIGDIARSNAIFKHFQGVLNVTMMAQAGTVGRHARRGTFNRNAGFKTAQQPCNITDATKVDQPLRGAAFDKGPNPLAGIHQPVRLELAQGFAHNRARHAKGCANLVLGRKLGPLAQIARDDLFQDLTIKLVCKFFTLLKFELQTVHPPNHPY